MEITVKITKEDMLDEKSRKELTTALLTFAREMWIQSRELQKDFKVEPTEPTKPEPTEPEPTEPTEPEATEYTLAYLRQLANQKAKENLANKEIIIKLTQEKYGANGFADIKKSDYASLAADLEAL